MKNPSVASEPRQWRHFNAEMFVEMTDVDPDIQAAVVDIYLNTGRKILRTIQQAAATGNPVAVVAAAHTGRGGIAMFGAAQIVQTLEKIETAALVGDLSAVATDLDQLTPWLQEFMEELSRFRAGLKSA